MRNICLPALLACVLVWPHAARATEQPSLQKKPVVSPSPPLPPAHPPLPNHTQSGKFVPQPDRLALSPDLPPHTVVVELRDADDAPVPATWITLEGVESSVSQGERRFTHTARTTEQGDARFSDLTQGGGTTYRVQVAQDIATFNSALFTLQPPHGLRVRLHVYPVTRTLQDAAVVIEASLYAELQDDKIQMEELLSIWNVGKTAWVPDALLLQLPERSTALRGEVSTHGQGVDAQKGGQARLHGTFPPGRSDVTFRWQVPYTGRRTQALDLGLPPHVVAVRILTDAAPGISLHAPSFAPPSLQTGGTGKRFLTTTWELHPGELPLDTIHIALQGLPGIHWTRLAAVGLTACCLLGGVVFSLRTRSRSRSSRAKADREALLPLLHTLEVHKHEEGLGPKTYTRKRTALLQALAYTFLEEKAEQASPQGKAPFSVNDPDHP